MLDLYLSSSKCSTRVCTYLPVVITRHQGLCFSRRKARSHVCGVVRLLLYHTYQALEDAAEPTWYHVFRVCTCRRGGGPDGDGNAQPADASKRLKWVVKKKVLLSLLYPPRKSPRSAVGP